MSAFFFDMMSYYVYILFSDSINKYYIGYSNDPWLRLTYHNTNEKDKYTGKGKPWRLCAVFLAKNKTAAISIERYIKKKNQKIYWKNFATQNLF